KPPKVALTALMRKLIELANISLVKWTTLDASPKPATGMFERRSTVLRTR
ncbi:MAG: hypothetical protein ACI91Z_000994, partial [Yoonia sp.]